MHRYSFHIGDYAAHTRHLTPLEDIAYRRMLDAYYLHERPLPTDVQQTARLIDMRDHVAEVEAVLREFFEPVEGRGWVSERADAEIAEYRAKQEQAQRAGTASAAARAQVASPRRRATRATPVERPSNARSTAQGTDAQPTLTLTLTSNQVPPNPPTGASAARAEPAAEGAESVAVVRLQDALMATLYRGHMPSWDRRRHLLKRAEELIATGLSPFDVGDLARLDAAKAETPGALLATWLDQNTWREVLDEQRAKQNAAGARRRGRAAQAEGAPATEPVPVGAAIDGVLPAAPAKETGDG